MARTVNQAGIKLIKRWEGLRLKVYRDVGGKATVGYGHLVLPGEDFSKGLTLKQAEELFQTDVDRIATGVENALTIDVSDDQFAALVSFTYNVGVTAFATSTMCMLINKGDWDGAAGQFPRWCRVKYRVSGRVSSRVDKGLLNRRFAEQALFEQGS